MSERERERERERSGNSSSYKDARSFGIRAPLLQPLFVLCLVTQLGLILGDPMNCGTPGSAVHGNSPGKNTGMVAMPSSRGTSRHRY